MAKTLEQYLRETNAVQYFLEVVKREEGKPIEYKIAPYGIPATPFTDKLAPEAPAKADTSEKK